MIVALVVLGCLVLAATATIAAIVTSRRVVRRMAQVLTAVCVAFLAVMLLWLGALRSEWCQNGCDEEGMAPRSEQLR